MNHEYITEHAIVERYVMGLLLPEECAAFEAHFRNCSNCLHNVEAIRDYRIGVEEPLKPGPRSIPWRWILGGAVAALLFAAGPLVWSVRNLRGAERRINGLSAEIARLNEDSRRAAAETGQLRGELSRNAAPSSGSVPIFSLLLTRGGEDSTVNRVRAVNSGWLVLSLEYVPDPAVKSYRARIEDAQGKTVATVDPLAPATSDALGVALRADVLKPGNYRAVLEGVTRNGRSTVVARYAFSVA